ncbi:MAG: membrane protein insertase YidC [Candidatus Omnitrophica bacterium]|nr:membrane protein insertase YidC [Candidatus Omnitrophota bacterium]
MEKRLLLAMFLSFLIMFIWYVAVVPMYHIDNKEVINNNLTLAKTQINAEQNTLLPESKENISTFIFEQDKFKLEFIESRAAIKEIVFKDYPDSKLSLENGLAIDEPILAFRRINTTNNSVLFQYVDNYKMITKEFIFSNSSYELWLEINVQNESKAPLKINYPLWLGTLNFSSAIAYSQFQEAIIQTQEKTLHTVVRANKDFPKPEFIGLRNRYFCAIMQPDKIETTALLRKINGNLVQVGIISKDFNLSPGEKIKQKFHIYLGPQNLQLIKAVNPQWSAIIYYGTFDAISQLLIQILDFIQRLVHNWGLAIIILSITVYFLLFPLTLKQMRSIKEMQVLQPKIEELRNIYKNNPQKLNKEIMELYKEHKVNPFGGCLPLILQIPIFFALYQALIRSINLKGAHFLGIKDLSAPDQLLAFKFSLPILGNAINILPILMAIAMFVQQKISSVGSMNKSAAEQQKIMTLIMPIILAFFFYPMPSGLVLYWLVNNLLMLVHQFKIRIK